MQAEETSFMENRPEEGFEPYRSVSKAAALSIFLGLLSLAGFLFPAFLFLAVLGLICGIFGYRKVLRYPNELTGKVPALLGISFSVATFLAGTVTHSIIYATEVPDGYRRVPFASLKSRGDTDVPPEEVLELDGQDVFIKGYVYPDVQKYGIKRFVLVPDLGTCCFGGQPKLTHMIEVTLNAPLKIDYDMRKRRLAGKLTVDRALKPVTGVGGVYYQMTADYVK